MGSKKNEREQLLKKIVEHEYVPRVEVLSKEEARKVLKKLHARVWQLPWLRANDPLALAVGAKPGDVVRIVRKSPSSGEFVAYRFVVPG